MGGPQVIDPHAQALINAYPGRPHQVTINNGGHPVPAILDTIPPIQTLPSDLASRSEAGIIATWEKEPLLVDEPIDRLVAMVRTCSLSSDLSSSDDVALSLSSGRPAPH
jgi:hypothetical protein